MSDRSRSVKAEVGDVRGAYGSSFPTIRQPLHLPRGVGRVFSGVRVDPRARLIEPDI